MRRRGFWAGWGGWIITAVIGAVVVALLVGWVLLWVSRPEGPSIALLTLGAFLLLERAIRPILGLVGQAQQERTVGDILDRITIGFGGYDFELRHSIVQPVTIVVIQAEEIARK